MDLEVSLLRSSRSKVPQLRTAPFSWSLLSIQSLCVLKLWAAQNIVVFVRMELGPSSRIWWNSSGAHDHALRAAAVWQCLPVLRPSTQNLGWLGKESVWWVSEQENFETSTSLPSTRRLDDHHLTLRHHFPRFMLRLTIPVDLTRTFVLLIGHRYLV